MNQQCQSEIDALLSEDLIGRRVHLALEPETVGHVTCVITRLGSRAYTVDWCVNGELRQADFYGFQLVLED